MLHFCRYNIIYLFVKDTYIYIGGEGIFMDYQTMQRFESLIRTKQLSQNEREEHRLKLFSFLLPALIECEKKFSFLQLAKPITLEERATDITKALMAADEDSQLIDCIMQLKETTPQLFSHSVEVCYISMFIMEQEKNLTTASVRQLKLYYKDVLHLGIAGILHDIGKFNPNNNTIIERKETMTALEKQQYRGHVINSNGLLKRKKLEPSIAQGILQHHETCDGHGFPLNLHDSNISETGKMLAIADFYAHWMEQSDLPDRTDPFAVAYILNAKSNLYDINLIKKFCTGFLTNLVGKKVLLSDQTEAIFLSLNEKHPRKSQVEIQGKQYNLEKETTLEIMKVIS